MASMRLVRFCAALFPMAALAAGCSSPQPEAVPVLDCTAGDIHHRLRVHAAEGQVEDLSFTPVKVGTADVSDARYVLRFPEHRDRYELILTIDRSTGTGMRELFDDEQQAIKGNGGTDALTCVPDGGRQ